MPRRSPPTDRVVGVLEMLAAHAGEPMTFTEVMREAGLSRATCHAVLLSLHEAGYVIRDDQTRSYVLGPAVAALGKAAELSFPYVPAVRHLVQDVVAETGYSCVLTKAMNGWVTVLDHEGTITGPDHLRRGSHVPFVAPYAAVHAAWARPDVRNRWLQAEGLTKSELVRLLGQVEQRGFSVSPLDDARRNLRELMGMIKRDVVSQDLRRLLERTSGPVARDYLDEEMATEATLAVSSVSCPVFDGTGRVALGMHLEVLEEIRRDDVLSMARSLRRAAAGASEIVAAEPVG